jgi:hypothetical protein
LNWTVANVTLAAGQNAMYPAFKDANNGVIVSLGGDVLKSTDGGTTWSGSVITGQVFRSVVYVTSQSTYVCVGTGGVVYKSKDNGSTWTAMTSGITDVLRNVSASTTYTWAVGASGKIIRLTNSALTSTGSEVNKLASFSLEQNYPNPFNPSTTIKFGLASESKVTLTIFNSLGENITTIVNSNLQAGTHTIEFNASELPTGIYYARLNAIAVNGDNFTQTIKMALMK